MLQLWISMPPYINKLVARLFIGAIQYSGECGGLFFSVAGRLIPISLRVGKI